MKANINPRSIAVVLKEDKVLMWWRYSHKQEHHGFPGGTIEEGETPEETLIREVYEELNLKVLKYEKFYEWNHSYDIEDKHYERLERYYFITDFEGEIKLGAPELFRQSRENIYRPEWLNAEELDRIEYNPREVIDLILKKLSE